MEGECEYYDSKKRNEENTFTHINDYVSNIV